MIWPYVFLVVAPLSLLATLINWRLGGHACSDTAFAAAFLALMWLEALCRVMVARTQNGAAR